MKVIITGGSGFIGTRLVKTLQDNSHETIVLDRNPPQGNIAFHAVDLMKPIDPRVLSGTDAIIHLAGVSIFQRWNKGVKKLIYDSRVKTTRNIIEAIRTLDRPPRIFISASAVGFYGDQGETLLTEESQPGTDFLANLCRDWEATASRAREYGSRVVHIRTAPVLGPGGLLGTLLPLFRLGIGGSLGRGNQWFPWVHIQDIVESYRYSLEHEGIQGPLNVVAPQIVRNAEFTKTLASILHRPAVIRTPVWALRLVFNDLADAIVSSQKVSSQKLEHLYSFRFSNLTSALKDIL